MPRSGSGSFWRAGLIRDFGALRGAGNDPDVDSARVSDFYERTFEFELDARPEGNGLFKLFGRALAWMFRAFPECTRAL